jgi:hypothetical protein
LRQVREEEAATQFCVELSRVRSYLEIEWSSAGREERGKVGPGEEKGGVRASDSEPEVEAASH